MDGEDSDVFATFRLLFLQGFLEIRHHAQKVSWLLPFFLGF